MSDENDDEPDFPCGCHSVYEHHEFAYWIMCPLHEAAEDLLAACKAVFAEFDERMSQEGMQLDSSPKSHYSPGFNAMLLAIKKAEGKAADL